MKKKMKFFFFGFGQSAKYFVEELLKSKNKSILRKVEKTYCDIGMCNYTTILMMYKEQSKAANQSLEW